MCLTTHSLSQEHKTIWSLQQYSSNVIFEIYERTMKRHTLSKITISRQVQKLPVPTEEQVQVPKTN